MKRLPFCACIVLLFATLGVAWAQMPQVREDEVGSRIVKEWMEKADEYARSADARTTAGAFTEAAFDIEDANVWLGMSMDFALPANHPAVAYVQDEIAKAGEKLEAFGGGESEEDLAEQWFDRIFWELNSKMAAEYLDEEAVGGAEAYYLARYVPNVMITDLEKAKEKYANEEAMAQHFPDAAGNYDGAVESIELFAEKYKEIIQASLPGMEQEVRTRAMKLMEEDCLTSDFYRALDDARLLLAIQPDNELATKTKDKAEERILERRQAQEQAYREELESARMPEDVKPGDAALHDQMKAAYLKEIQKRGWSPGEIMRIVVTSDWSEGWEAWWVENEIRAGYFKKVYGAVAIKQASGTSVKQCLFRQQRQDGGWSGLYLAKVITSYTILEENVNE